MAYDAYELSQMAIADRDGHSSEIMENIQEGLRQEFDGASDASQCEDAMLRVESRQQEEGEPPSRQRVDDVRPTNTEPRLWGHRGWDQWEWRLKVKATLAGVWNHIESRGTVPLPTEPAPVRYEDFVTSDIYTDKQPDLAPIKKWKHAHDKYLGRKLLYAVHVDRLAELKEWFKQTLAQRFYTTCCEPETEIWKWYAKIKAKVDDKRKVYEEKLRRLEARVGGRVDQGHGTMHDNPAQKHDDPSGPAPEDEDLDAIKQEAYQRFVKHVYALKNLPRGSRHPPLDRLSRANDISNHRIHASVAAREEAIAVPPARDEPLPPVNMATTRKRKAVVTEALQEQNMDPRTKVRKFHDTLEAPAGGHKPLIAPAPILQIKENIERSGLGKSKSKGGGTGPQVRSLKSKRFILDDRQFTFNLKSPAGVSPWEEDNCGMVTLPTPYPFALMKQALITGKLRFPLSHDPRDRVRHLERKIRQHLAALEELLQESRENIDQSAASKSREEALEDEIRRLRRYIDCLNGEIGHRAQKICVSMAKK